MNICQNNRLTLTSDQWTFISNIIHLCDETKFIHQINYLLAQSSSIPIKLRVKQSFICQYIQYAFESIDILMRRSSDFQSLAIDSRRTIIQRNTIDICLVYSLLLRAETNIFEDLNLTMYLYGSEIWKQIICLFTRVEHDSTVIKIMVFVLMFASNSSTSYILQTNAYDQSTTDNQIVQIQNIFITVLWKYLIYQYGYFQAIIRYSSLIKILLDFSSIIEQIQTCEKLVQTFLNEILLKNENFDLRSLSK